LHRIDPARSFDPLRLDGEESAEPSQAAYEDGEADLADVQELGPWGLQAGTAVDVAREKATKCRDRMNGVSRCIQSG
jgi:hypothetical protein